VVATKDFSGLGWAKRLRDEGEDVVLAWGCDEDNPELKRQMQMIAKGVVEVLPLDEAVADIHDAYWVFDGNHHPEVADRLRERGERVFGTSALSDRMEHERAFGVSVAEECGLHAPPSHEFATLDEGIAFLEAHPDTAFVFKPDDGKFNYMTFVPMRKAAADANRDVATYLAHMQQEPGPFILQERIDQDEALEVNCEVWFYEGEPLRAYWNTELKRKNTGDGGEMTGCAGDFGAICLLDAPLVQQTIGRMFAFYKGEAYTGPADVNVIFDRAGTPWFLEVCNRCGYNATPTLLFGLTDEPLGDVLAAFMDGDTERFVRAFRRDRVAGSLTLFLDHPREGLPLHIDPAIEGRYFPFDLYAEDGQYLLTGFNSPDGAMVDNPEAIGILVAHGPSIESVAASLLDDVRAERVAFADAYWRTDLGDTDYDNAPARRLAALRKRGLLP